MLKARAVVLVLSAMVLGFCYHSLGYASLLKPVLSFEYAGNFVRLVLLVTTLSVFHKVGLVFPRSAMLRSGAREGEVTMILRAVKFAFTSAGFIASITYLFSLGTFWAISAVFGGMPLGWSLQGRASAFAAWFPISIIGSLSASDQPRYTSYYLAGDVISMCLFTRYSTKRTKAVETESSPTEPS